MKYFLSFDDYSEDNYKLAKLLLKFNLNAVFFIELRSNGNQLRPIEQIRALSEMGFEIGCHSLDHPILSNLDIHELEINVSYAKGIIEDVTGSECKWYCPPKGKYNTDVIKTILNSGFKYIRTVDVLNCEDIKEGINKTTIHVYPRKEYNGEDWDVVAKRCVSEIKSDGGCFKLWGHSWEISKYNNWEPFEKFLYENIYIQ